MYIRARGQVREEQGQVLALVAVSSVVILLFAALVIDVGNWFSHKRQLQNRADAGALAAGVEYQKSWLACISGDAATETTIGNNAHAYAGDPNPTVPVITPANTETANQANVSVLVNSTSYDAASSDGGGPCFNHPADPNDPVSPNGGYWTDVKVKERDLNSFFGSLGIPLPRNIARARVEIHPAISDNGFIPLAVPEFKIEKAQVRYYGYCNGFNNAPAPAAPLAKTDLSQLEAAYQVNTGTTFWGPALNGSQNNPAALVPPSSIPLTVPAKAGCSFDYVPIAVEVRVSGRAGIDIDTPTCATLAASSAQFTDCWSAISTIRGWKSRGAGPLDPIFKNVTLSGGTCSPDAYFSRQKTCTANIAVDADFGDLDDGNRSVPANFAVTVAGQPLTPPSLCCTGVWTSNGAVPVGNTGGSNAINLSYSWEDKSPSHQWRLSTCKANGNNPCRSSANALPVHRTFTGTDTTAGTVDLLRTASVSQPANGALPLPLDNIATPDAVPVAIAVFPTIGIRSSIRARQFRTLREPDPNVNQSLNCNAGNQGSDFQMFLNGCTPFYGPNSFTPGFWWTPTNPPSSRCPDRQAIAAALNSPSDFWQCAPMATGLQGSVIADGIAARTGNCGNVQSNSCGGQPVCNNPNRYANLLAGNGDPSDPRIVKLFIVPFASLKGLQAQDGVPISDFGVFYITGWGGNGANADPCTGNVPNQGDPPDDTLNPDGQPLGNGEIVGYFIEFTGPNTGPTDPNATCVIGQIRPCRAVLVR